MNPGSVYSMKMVTSVFGRIVVNAHWQRAFVIGIWPITWGDALRNLVFQKDNAQQYAAGIVRILFHTKSIWLLPWPARSPDLSLTKTSGLWLYGCRVTGS
ncbi:hypothetical protein TNCV_4116131 [Trichonephila clavipes]|nr:hypothetical protein TNCV_4116131 [Trichonephila clavipes]